MKSGKLGVYLPIKNIEIKKDYITNPGMLDEDTVKKFLKKARNEFPDWTITEDLDFKKFSIVNNETFFNDKPADLDVYLWYSGIDTAHNSYSIHVLKHLARKCRVIKNPFAEEIGLDKYFSHELLRSHNLEVADFAFISSLNIEFAKSLLNKWNAFVVKPRLGSYGVGTLLIKDFPTLRDLFGILKESLGKLEVTLLVERFYEHDIEEWTSVTMFGHKVIYGYRKKRQKFAEGWKVYNDYKIQGDQDTIDYVDPIPEVKEIAEKASRILNADIIGFDFIKTKEGFRIVDENTWPGFYQKCFKEAGTTIEDEFIKLIKNSSRS